MSAPDFDYGDDPDRCILCDEIGCLDGSVQHRPECPSTTDLWPVTEWEVEHEVSCPTCKEVFRASEFYTHVPHPDEENVVIVTCLSCAFTRRGEAQDQARQATDTAPREGAS